MDPATTPALSVAAAAMRTSVFAALQRRIDAFRVAGGDLIPLQIGDTHRPPPAAALTAMLSQQPRDLDELGRYQAVAGLTELRQSIATKLVAGGWPGIGVEHIHVGCGCTHALFCAARAILDPGAEVLVISPYWPLISGVLRTVGAVSVEVPLTQRLYADPDVDIAAVLDASRTERTRALYLITPNNPDGHIYTRHQLEQFADYARRHNLWILADEVYADYTYDSPHQRIAMLPEMAARTVTSHSLSKSHGLAGARIGYVVASPEVIAATRRISNHTVYNVPVAMQRVALAAMADADWTEQARLSYRAARDAISAALSARGIAHRLPHGGTFFFLDLRQRLAGEPLTKLLEAAIERGVLLAPGEAFGAGFEGHARLCFTGAPLDRVIEGVNRFAQALDNFSSGARS